MYGVYKLLESCKYTNAYVKARRIHIDQLSDKAT